MQTIHYTIIIPHRNIPTLLRRCIASIPIRNDLQIIVVDDCTDKYFANDYRNVQEEFPSVEFIETDKQRGGGAARNLGLERAKGEYILFADADDFFYPCLNEILSDYKNSDWDIIFFNVNSVNAETLLPSKRGTHVNKMFRLAQRNLPKAEFLLKYEFGEPWCKMISHKLIKKENIHFEETKIHNDTRFSYLVGFYSQKIKLDARILYCNTERPQSVSTIISDERILLRARIFSEKIVFLRKHGVQYFDILLLRAFFHCQKHHRQDLFKRCGQIASAAGISQFEICFRLAVYRFKLHLFNLKNRIKVHRK